MKHLKKGCVLLCVLLLGLLAAACGGNTNPFKPALRQAFASQELSAIADFVAVCEKEAKNVRDGRQQAFSGEAIQYEFPFGQNQAEASETRDETAFYVNMVKLNMGMFNMSAGLEGTAALDKLPLVTDSIGELRAYLYE